MTDNVKEEVFDEEERCVSDEACLEPCLVFASVTCSMLNYRQSVVPADDGELKPECLEFITAWNK